MRSISLWQPWASLVALEAKKFETRSWETPYRGPLLIHAAKKWNEELAVLAASQYFYHHLYEVNPRMSQLPKGCYIALVDLVDIYPTDQVKVTFGERLFGDYSAGRFAWKLENVRRLSEPIPARGYQALWTPDAGIVELVNQRIATNETH